MGRENHILERTNQGETLSRISWKLITADEGLMLGLGELPEQASGTAFMREKRHNDMVTMTVDRNRCSRYLATVLGKEHMRAWDRTGTGKNCKNHGKRTKLRDRECSKTTLLQGPRWNQRFLH